MQFYILRHAIAVPRGTPGYPNDDRPLTEEGIRKMIENARAIEILAGKFDAIISSPLIRALHTANIVSEYTGYKGKISITEFLLPGNPQRSLFNYLSNFNQQGKICIVGHEPHLGFIASKLIGSGDPGVEFKKGGICRIDLDKFPPLKPGKLVWLLQPKQLKLILSSARDDKQPEAEDE
jgi:phosphohistidine phosphatase